MEACNGTAGSFGGLGQESKDEKSGEKNLSKIIL